MSDIGPYFTPEHVAKALGLNSAYYIETNARHWPHIKIAGRYRFTADQVEEIVRRHTVTPAAPVVSTGTAMGRKSRGGAR